MIGDGSRPRSALPGVNGKLLLSLVPGGEGTRGVAGSHRSEFVNGPEGIYLADNDLRGFLDGRFAAGWNQAGQSYTRVGRNRYRKRPPKQGEDELFRTLQRWSGIDLPAGCRILDARLLLHTHAPVPKDGLVYLYAVRRDWNPGRGGVREDNVSVPAKGEVWWRDARFEEESWGLPGAGFAADGHPEADTDAQPLGVARCLAGADRIELGGDRLSSYVEERLGRGDPLLFLLKLSDSGEDDEEGSLIKILSGEFGHELSSALRPRLQLEWSPPPESDCRETEILLEHGRELVLPPVRLPNGVRLWAGFASEPGFEPPTLQFREASEGNGSTGADWHPLSGPVASRTGSIEIRVLAARSPIALGDPFASRFRESWVVSAPAEDQRLEWRFTSPSGVATRIDATYEGRRVWRVTFVPDELGRWTVQWRHRFAGPEEIGPEEAFDVVAPSLESVCDRLRALGDGGGGRALSGSERERALGTLVRLERAGMRGLTPQAFRGADGSRLRSELDRARERLGGETLPGREEMTSIPLREEAGDRRFAEPIPRCSAFRSEEYEPAPPGPAAAAAAVGRRIRKLARRLARAASRTRRSGS